MKQKSTIRVLLIAIFFVSAVTAPAHAADVATTGSTTSVATTSGNASVTTDTTTGDPGTPDFVPSGVLMELGTVDQGYCDPMDPNFKNCVCPPTGDANQLCCKEAGHERYKNCDGDPLRKQCRDTLGALPGGSGAAALAACCTALGYTATCENSSDSSGGSGVN